MGINSTTSPSPLPRGQGGGTKLSNPLITRLVLLAISPYPPRRSKRHFINITKDSCSYLLGIPGLFFFVLGPHPWLVEIPRLGVLSELQLQVYITATTMPDPGLGVCTLHHSSQRALSLTPLSEARYPTRNRMVPNRIHFRCATMGTPWFVTSEPQWELFSKVVFTWNPPSVQTLLLKQFLFVGIMLKK